MRVSIVIAAVFGTAAASPLAVRAGNWSPLPGTTATCGDQEKYMSLVIGPEDSKSILKHSCAAFMPPCAYKAENKLSEDAFCTAVDVYPLDEPKNVTLPVLVEQGGNKLARWAVNFFVIPKKQTVANFPESVFWSTSDCEGYINELVQKSSPEGCNISGIGPGAGNLTIGAPTEGTSTLTGTVVGVKFVQK
ncbi:hypothetical protein DM02DRAFT_362178 [Periconia macrospinosa]|uniref:Ecp2 effector protein domain-containing protein n=1 Tax=Periconia macrospinosa TaxID=97972 RepID=A0A2V1CZP6_9PLEO|nr:hypothetical protein DM02DRAFT_362178 [Periconia macrospinosa]